MRYNPATDNAVYNERVQAEMNWARRPAPITLVKADLPAEVEPEQSETDKAITAITYNLWETSGKLSRLTRAELDDRDFNSLIRDVQEVVDELRKLCTRV